MAYVYEETAQAEDETNDQVVVGVPGSMKYHTTYQMSPEDDERQEEEDLTNMKELEDFITNPENSVLVYPLLITVSGLTQTGKTNFLQKAFDLLSAEETKFSHHEIVASGFGMNKPIMTLNVRRDTSFLFGLQSGLKYNHKKASFVHQNTEGLTIKYFALEQYLSRVLRYLQNRQNKTNIVSNISKNRTVISEQDNPHVLDDKSKGTTTTSEASDFGPPTEGPYEKSTHELEQMLFHGVGFVNIWDTVVDKTIRPFLETFGSFYTRSVLWLFVDLERDLPDIHLPPEVIEVDSKAFKWRSRIEYLLRQCQMCKHSHYKKAAKDKVCTIFATYSSSKTPHPEPSAEKLQHECEEAARQMGVDHLIDFDIILVDKDKKKAKPLRDRLRLCLEQVEAKSVPLSWILLRGSFTQHKDFCIKYSDLQKIAKECGLQNEGEHSLDEFLKFYGSFGSIFDVRQVNNSSEYVIIKPIKFLSSINKFLRNVKHENGIISTNSSSDEYAMLEIMASVSIAVKLPNLDMENRYFFRSIRKGKRKTFIAQGRVQFVLSMASPRINQNAEIIKLLLIALAPNVEFDPNTEWPNSVCIITTVSGAVIEIFLSFQGDVIEIHLQVKEECLVNTDQLVEKIVKAFEDMIFQKKHLTDIRYHFAIRCEQDEYGNTITYNAYHKRHVLPTKMCDKCSATQKDRKIIHSWNRALEKHPIADNLKLNGDLSPYDVAKVVEEVSKYPIQTVGLLAKELAVTEYFDKHKETHSKMWLLFGMMNEWQSQLNKEDESPKKVLARHLVTLDGKWAKSNAQDIPLDSKDCDEEPKFIELARKIDMQVLTPHQLKILEKQRRASELSESNEEKEQS